MSYLSLLKSLPNNLRQPAGIAFIASIGVHGLVGISLPLLSSSETETPDQQQKVQVVELSPDQAQRLPQAVLPQQQTASIPVPGNQFPANFFKPGTQNGRNPGLSLVPLPGFPNLYRLPSGMNTYNQQPYYIPDPRSQGAPPRNPGGLGQQPAQRPDSPLFDNDILSKETPWSTARNIFTPDSPNLRINGNSSPSPSPSATPSPQPSPTATNPSPSPSSSLSPFAVGTPSPGAPSPTTAPTSPTATPGSPTIDPDLLAYNPDGTAPEDANNELLKWSTQAQDKWQDLVIPLPTPPEARSVIERPARVVVGVFVDGDGKLLGEPSLIQKSGYKLLDDVALNAVKSYNYDSKGTIVPYLVTLKFTSEQ
jgi:hypothetical protein